MRGTPSGSVGGVVGAGIIPAHAGNTAKRLFPNFIPRDHPRACGEHACAYPCKSIIMGSSPRMRGTPIAIYQSDAFDGIIPAHAGNTL